MRTPTLRNSLLILFAATGIRSPLTSADWPHFLGLRQDLHSEETGLDFDFTSSGPKLLWEVERGKGHAGPVVADGKLVFIHQVEQREQVRCLDAVTGSGIWEHSYPVDVAQSYGIVDAPRSSPVIDPETKLVYTLGNDGDLICFSLSDGKIAWQVKLPQLFGPSPFFFGYGSCPLIFNEKLIVHAGAEDACVVALNKKDGTVIWQTDHEWHGSYASPVVAELNGQKRILIFAGGMVKPPTGGLLCVNPENGKIDSEFSWRSDNFASVNATTPVSCGENRVFLTEDYGLGGVMLEYGPDFTPRVMWTSPEFGCQFQTPLYHEGVLYGFGGNGGLMLAYDVATGSHLWNEAFYQTTIPWQGRDVPISLGHAHLIHVDGAFLCLSEDGALIRMDLSAAGFRILSSTRLFYAPETWAPPVVSNGRLYVNQNELGSRLLCFDLSGKAGN